MGNLKRFRIPRPKMYIFFRETGWYPLELKNDKDARENAECNPGTLRVETIEGKQVWPIRIESPTT